MTTFFRSAAAVFALSAMGTALQAQSVSYKVVEDDPYSIKKLHVHLDPFYIDLWGSNITMGFGARANFYVGRLGALNFEFRRSYLDVNQKSGLTADPTAARGTKAYTYIEPSLDFNFYDKTRTRSLKVTLSSNSYSSGGYTYTSEKYIMVDGTKRKVYSLHGGLYFLNTAVDISKGSGETMADGSIKSNFYAVGTGPATDTISAGYTNMSTMVVAAGLSTKSITNLIISCDWGNRGNSLLTRWYADVLFAPVITFADMKKSDGTVYNVYNNDKKRIGWRVGYDFHKPNRTFMSYKMEFGSKPGFAGTGKWSSGFLEFAVGFNLAML